MRRAVPPGDTAKAVSMYTGSASTALQEIASTAVVPTPKGLPASGGEPTPQLGVPPPPPVVPPVVVLVPTNPEVEVPVVDVEVLVVDVPVVVEVPVVVVKVVPVVANLHRSWAFRRHRRWCPRLSCWRRPIVRWRLLSWWSRL